MTDELWDVHRGEGPVVATAIHDGHELRPEVAVLTAVPEADRLREEDPFTARWTTIVDNRVVPTRSRFEVDLNRPLHKAVYRTPEDAWGHEVWRRPPEDAVVARSLEVYRAFYELMASLLADLERRYGRFVVVDLHSYNHRQSGPDRPPADPAANPVVNVGTSTLDRERWAPLVDRFLADLGTSEVDGAPLDARENVRFRGGHLVRWVHQTFPESGCGLAVEVKKVYMDEWTGEPDDAVVAQVGAALAGTLPGILESLRSLAPVDTR